MWGLPDSASKLPRPCAKTPERYSQAMSAAAPSLPKRRAPALAGWRELVMLPDLGAGPLIAKLDTGALSASLHAENIHVFDKNGVAHVRFDVPADAARRNVLACELPLHGLKRVKNTSGVAETRLVVETHVTLGDETWLAQVTLSDRTDMGVPMLLGRATIRGRFVVHPARSFLISEPAKKKPNKAKAS
jgi:hypothetical protein